ncbi:response regulator [Paenibacillaceae sp. P-4]|uniref:response regulator n=1 Tax=Paenibacillaceae bacterium P-4 TaxID=3160969 RepID=UPI0032E80836
MLRVMLADQDVIERRQAVQMVEEGGYTVVGQAGSQPEAWEQVEKLWPEVVIADTSGFGIDGLTLARGLSEREHPIVVVLTGRSSDHQLVLQAMRYGAIAFLPKPWKRDEVSDALRRASKLAGYYRVYHTQYGHIYRFFHRLGSLTAVDMLQEQQQLVQGLMRNARTADELDSNVYGNWMPSGGACSASMKSLIRICCRSGKRILCPIFSVWLSIGRLVRICCGGTMRGCLYNGQANIFKAITIRN